MDRSKEKGTFTGSIDELLDHCTNNIDVDRLYAECEKRECIEVLMREMDCTAEEAEVMYNEIALAEVQKTMDDLVKEGLVEVSGYNKKGEPLFSLTELGKKAQKQINKDK